MRSGTGLGPQQRRASRPLRSGTLLEEKRWVLEELKNREGHPGTRSALRWVPGHRCAGERGSAPPRAMEAGVAGHHAPRPRRQRLLVPCGAQQAVVRHRHELCLDNLYDSETPDCRTLICQGLKCAMPSAHSPSAGHGGGAPTAARPMAPWAGACTGNEGCPAMT